MQMVLIHRHLPVSGEREGASTPEEEKLLCDYKDAEQEGRADNA